MIQLKQRSLARICFVSNTAHANPYNDGSTRYRCHYPIAELRRQGYYSGIVTLKDYLISAPDADAYVFHRPTYSPGLALEIERLTGENKIIIADYDDLIFDVRNMRESSLFKRQYDAMATSTTFRDNLRAMHYFRHITVSTPYLRSCVLESHSAADVTVVRNGFPPEVFDFTRRKYDNKELAAHRIGYFPGTKTHDADFLIWQKSFTTAVNKLGLPVTVMGELDRDLLRGITDVTYIPGASFHSMLEEMAAVSVGIAPLEPTKFNASKSNIKSIEAFLLGCHSISTALNDTRVLSEQCFEIELIEHDNNVEAALSRVAAKPPLSSTNAELVQKFYSTKRVIKPMLDLLNRAVP